VVSRPTLLLADEPTGNLDNAYAAEIMLMFKAFHQAGTTIIISTHDQSAISAGRVIHLEHGKVTS
jgi:cell division transport system ATP-binding protein